MACMPDEQLPAPPPTAAIEVCYRHPKEQTRVHCTRCGRPICPDCMIPAPVGYQCPECVEQARRLRGGVSATKVLLAAIVGMFVVEVLVGGTRGRFSAPSGDRLIDLGAMQPLLIADGQYWRLFTAMFLHAGLLHILFNAYALY